MKNPGRPSRISGRNRLLRLLATEFHDPLQAYDLFEEFLRHKTYDESFCLRLIAAANQGPEVAWDIRRLAVLMLEHQILKLPPDSMGDFDLLLTRLKLKQGLGLNRRVVSSVLKEGYSTTDLHRFIPEFRRRLERLNRVHDKINGRRTSDAALRDFIEVSRRDCKLSLARYLFTSDEVVAEILKQVRVTGGVRDLDTAEPPYVKDEAARPLDLLPEFEAGILSRLCEDSKIYWVSDATGSEINSLVEYPVTTVVLVVKLPGSDIEFEIKRAGRKGRNALNVVYARDDYTVPPPHRLDGGSMQWLLRYEAQSAARFAFIYRLVHDVEAPLASYISRATIYSVPMREAEVPTLTYFTDSRVFGSGFREMRAAMKESVAAFKAEGYGSLPDLPGDLGLSAHFIGQVTPAQAIVSGTSSFRLDKLATYLSCDGPERYFKEGLGVEYSRRDAQRFADAVLEEVLGCYKPPDVSYQSHNQYLAAAFRVAENRARANRIYLSLVQQIAKCWGTLLALRGNARGESFVTRNVGLKSFWHAGHWEVKIIFMDHDALTVSGPDDTNFYAQGVVPNMALDETYIWGRSSREQFAASEVGCLRKIYKVGDHLNAETESLWRVALKAAYKKTQQELLTNSRLRPLFNRMFRERLLDWDTLVRGYIRTKRNRSAATRWKKEMIKMMAAKGYGQGVFESYLETMEQHTPFLERNSFLFDNYRVKAHGAGRGLK
ncbi:MAG: hypothetical protein QOE33_119 [Acidobacteriota bacterium]|nr:hypothetical protein [Acidobacteriota bacterium]